MKSFCCTLVSWTQWDTKSFKLYQYYGFEDYIESVGLKALFFELSSRWLMKIKDTWKKKKKALEEQTDQVFIYMYIYNKLSFFFFFTHISFFSQQDSWQTEGFQNWVDWSFGSSWNLLKIFNQASGFFHSCLVDLFVLSILGEWEYFIVTEYACALAMVEELRVAYGWEWSIVTKDVS